MAIIGVDLGGTKVAAALFDSSGQMYSKEVRLLDGATGDAVCQLVIDVIDKLRLQSPGVSFDAIGTYAFAFTDIFLDDIVVRLLSFRQIKRQLLAVFG